ALRDFATGLICFAVGSTCLLIYGGDMLLLRYTGFSMINALAVAAGMEAEKADAIRGLLTFTGFSGVMGGGHALLNDPDIYRQQFTKSSGGRMVLSPKAQGSPRVFTSAQFNLSMHMGRLKSRMEGKKGPPARRPRRRARRRAIISKKAL